jgi:hypothetical protein
MSDLTIGSADYDDEYKQVATNTLCAYHIFLFVWKICEHIYTIRNTQFEVFKLF